MAARPAGTETQDMRAKTEERYAAAKKLIEDTGYKRRVPELDAIRACLDGEILLPAAEEVARSVQRLRSRELTALRSERCCNGPGFLAVIPQTDGVYTGVCVGSSRAS
jgi:hypothetical protein